MKIVGILGFKGSGKDTAANALIADGYVKFAFADALKDVIASMFNWPRHLMEGDTAESRAWREKPDAWWAAKLDIENFSPRMAMQLIGTNVMRQHFSDQIWISNVENKIASLGHDKVVITDCRFENETRMVTQLGGKLIRIRKGPEPIFYQFSVNMNHPSQKIRQEALSMMHGHYAHIHPSEWAWNCIEVDETIDNNGTIADLQAAIRGVV